MLSCSTGISAAAQGAAAARVFSISRRPAIRPRRAASPFRHAIWRACRPICRSERFSGSRDSDRRRYGRGARVPEASAARPLRVSYRRPGPAAAAATLPSGSPASASRTSSPGDAPPSGPRHDLKTPDQRSHAGRALRTAKLPPDPRRLHDPCTAEADKRWRPLAASHSRTVLSTDPLAIVRPSGLNATLLTQSPWPSSTRSSSPLAASHSRTVLSYDPLAIVRPSGLNATL